MRSVIESPFASYRAMPRQARFWLHSESCYTQDELEFRQTLLKTRANSGIHPDYLMNPSAWFKADTEAFINLYDKSWIYSPAFKPQHILTQEDFHVPPVDGQRLNWSSLYHLMQQVGDYLILRNQGLAAEHFNQPMNYVFLDINNMLKGLSQNPNIGQVKEQLDLIIRYIRNIEKHISPLIGSDRLFLANFRKEVNEKIMPQINHTIESRLLQERLHTLAKIINQVSEERNRILHFALTTHQVNPHPYDFSITAPEDLLAFPTQAAKVCINKPSTLSIGSKEEKPADLRVVLDDCPHFSLMFNDDATKSNYQRAIADLSKLEQFQKIITQINGLLDKAGEVYTVYQFKEQLLSLLEQINHFIEESSHPIQFIIEANTQAYYKAIQEQQELPVWEKWFSNKEEQLKAFIKNQDTLAQFPSGFSELSKTTVLVQINVKEIIDHLKQTKLIETSFEAIKGKAQELEQLMGTMHHWIVERFQRKGLPAPQPPRRLNPMVTPVNNSKLNTVIKKGAAFFSPRNLQANPCAPSLNCPSDSLKLSTEVNPLISLGLSTFISLTILSLFICLYSFLNKSKRAQNETALSRTAMY